jgi:hypothetical protein
MLLPVWWTTFRNALANGGVVIVAELELFRVFEKKCSGKLNSRYVP